MTWENFLRNSPISSSPGFCFVLLVVRLKDYLKPRSYPREKTNLLSNIFLALACKGSVYRRASRVTNNTADTRII